MEEKQSRAFYLTYGLLVIGFYFLLFTLLSTFMDNNDVSLYFYIGLITFIAGLLTGAGTLLYKSHRKKKNLRKPFYQTS